MDWPRYLLGMLATIGAIVLAIELDGDILFLWVPPAILTVFGGTAGLLVATFPRRQLLSGFRVAMGRLEDRTPEERAHALVVLSAAMRYPCGLGALNCLIWFVAMLRNLSDPAQVGPAMACSLVGAVFALLIAELLVAPLWFRVAAAQGSQPSAQAPPRPPASLAPIAVVLLCLLSMLLLLVSLR